MAENVSLPPCYIESEFIIQTPMKYQDFYSDENSVSSEDMIFIFHMWRYHGCHGYLSLTQ